MKRLLPFLLLACSGTFARADAPSTDAAQEAYAKGDYQRAITLYDSLNTQWTSAGLLFNIGNCYSKLNDVPRSILYYERALRLSPGAEDIQANLDMARAKTVDRVNELPAFTLGSLWDRLRGGKDVDQWARRSLWACLFTCVLAAAGAWIRPRGLKRAAVVVASAGALVTVICIGLAAYRVSEANDRSEAIILSPKLDVLSEPRTGSTKLFMLHGGTKLHVLQEQDGWFEVKLANGSVGWAPALNLARI
jgi:tetratricopeptide (TPR) repeat protein